MHGELQEAIRDEALKHIRRYSERAAKAAEYRANFTKRTGLTAGLTASSTPRHWQLDKQFNPFYVRSRSEVFATSIATKIRSQTYSPKPSLRQTIPKATGGVRMLSIFSVPDSAVATWLYRKLVARNGPFFSSFAFAYRPDRNAHHAIQHIAQSVRNKPRVFLLEYDFSAFFDSISHDYLISVLENQLKTSPRELMLVKTFLSHSYAETFSDYQSRNFKTAERGIPQGSSVSLYLANVACLELDRQLEKTGAIFARYADDTVIVCDDYATATKAASIMLGFRHLSGAIVNFKKSEGISMVTPSDKVEIKSKKSFIFLGHEISSEGVAPSEKSILRWKRMVANIVNIHLLKHPRKGEFSAHRISASGTDWDLVRCVNELRRRIYGRITQDHLSAALMNPASKPLRRTICVLTYYPLVDSPQKFKQMDGWLASILYRAYKKRRRLLAQLGHKVLPINRSTLISGKWYRDKAICNETKLPSFFRAWLYIRKCHNTYGLRDFPSPPYSS